jgi:hypothetical protein
MAGKQRAKQWAECWRRHDEEDRRQRVTVITEFDTGDPGATLHALAGEILRYREVLWLLAQAIGWASTGKPFRLFPPGPFRRPRGIPSRVLTSRRLRRRLQSWRWIRLSSKRASICESVS